MTAVSATVSAGYSLAALNSKGADDEYARYAAARSIALLLTVASVPVWRSRALLTGLGLTMAGVQALDALVGVTTGDATKTAGPAGLAVVSAVVVLRYARSGRPVRA